MQGADRLSTPTLLLMLFRLRHGVRVNPEDRVERPVLLYDVETAGNFLRTVVWRYQALHSLRLPVLKTGQKAARDMF
ncbi:hypothetical protein HR12_27325 [Microbacterium sp. SUBG005]|nr:hypothetical protein HR12_27325 [Microbacterium sp. SUBG005]